MNIISLSPFDLSMAAVLVVVLAFISLILKLGIASSIVIAAIRTVVQLLLIGLVLKTLFAYVDLLWVALLSIFMLVEISNKGILIPVLCIV